MNSHVLKTMTHSVSVLHHAAEQGVVERRYADALHESKDHIAELIAAADGVVQAFRAIGNDRTVITPPGLVKRAEDAMKRLDAAVAIVGSCA